MGEKPGEMFPRREIFLTRRELRMIAAVQGRCALKRGEFFLRAGVPGCRR
jgi:hypothetical protein